MTEQPRPGWVVIAKGSSAKLEHVIRAHLDDLEPVEIADGTRGHLCVMYFEAGPQDSGEVELANLLSAQTGAPAYSLIPDYDYPSVHVHARGEDVGQIYASPDAVARELGCTFPHIDAGDHDEVDLTPIPWPTATDGEPTFGRYTVTQWRHMIDHETEWSVMLDGIDDAGITRLLGWLAHRDPEARRAACDMLGALSYVEVGTRERECLDRIRALADSDPVPAVRATATKRAEQMTESVEWNELCIEFPWARGNLRAPDFEAALVALDDSRPAVRSAAAMAWNHAFDVPPEMRARALAKLEPLAKGTDDEWFEWAIEKLRSDD